MLFSDTLSVGGGGSPTHAADAHPVGAVGDSSTVSIRAVTSGLA